MSSIYLFVVGFLAAMVVYWLFLKYMTKKRRYQELQKQFVKKSALLERDIKLARHDLAYFQYNREKIVELSDKVDQTRVLYLTVIDEVDDMVIKVTAMSSRLLKLRQMVSEADCFNLLPLQKALEQFDWPFDYEPEQKDQACLFRGICILVCVIPTVFWETFPVRCKKIKMDWKKLLAAVQFQERSPEQVFGRVILNQLQELVVNHNISAGWLDQHPLYKDEAKLYKELASLQKLDPLAYLLKVTQLKVDEVRLKRQILEVVEMGKKALEFENYVLVCPESTVFEKEQNPFLIQRQALASAQQFKVLFSESTNLEELRLSSDYTRILFVSAITLAKEAGEAVLRGERLLLDARSNRNSVGQLFQEAKDQLFLTREKHPWSFLPSWEEYSNFQVEGDLCLEKAGKLLSEKKHWEAVAFIRQANSAYNNVRLFCIRSIDQCRSLDVELDEIVRKTVDLESKRRELWQCCHQEERFKALPDFSRPYYKGNYKAQLAEIALYDRLIMKRIHEVRRLLKKNNKVSQVESSKKEEK